MAQIKVKNLNKTGPDAVPGEKEAMAGPEPLVPSSEDAARKSAKPKNGGLKKKEDEDSGFTEHALPTADEIRDEEINESLAEIYHDENGGMVNVSRLDIKKRRGFFYYLFMSVLTLGVLGSLAWAGYKYAYLANQTGADSIELSIDAPKEAVSGQEFSYTVNYKNLDNIGIGNIEIKLSYPDNFIFLDASPAAAQKNNVWKIAGLGAHRSGKIEVKGKIVGPEGEVGVMLADMSYVPANFSSEFKKESSFETVISGIGIGFAFEAQDSVLVNETDEIIIKYRKSENGHIPGFRLTASGSDNFALATSTDGKAKDIELLAPGVWLVKAIGGEEAGLAVRFRFKDKKSATEDIMLAFEYSEDGEEYHKFLEKKLTFEIIKNDLNLNLILNGSRNDQVMDFGQAMNYSVVYSNRGEEEMKDVVIMAVLDGDALDWSGLDDKNKGKVRGNTISWSKEEMPALASLLEGAEGTIDFSIKVLPLDKAGAGSAGFDPNRRYEVRSYAQFSIGNRDSGGNEDTKSNIIISRMNSDLGIDEQIRYFNSDNIAVGSGPLPPKVGQTTGFRVFWAITNNLHELNGLKAETTLPQNVQWDNKNRAAAGSVQYDINTRKVTWDIGRLPADVGRLEAEFGIIVTPADSDLDTIMVLLPGTTVNAVDNATGARISKATRAKTTKLEDDEIAAGSSDGRVMR